MTRRERFAFLENTRLEHSLPSQSAVQARKGERKIKERAREGKKERQEGRKEGRKEGRWKDRESEKRMLGVRKVGRKERNIWKKKQSISSKEKM